ncbi:MAG: hypothetical protein ABEK75_07140 [Salinibacter sp.]
MCCLFSLVFGRGNSESTSDDAPPDRRSTQPERKADDELAPMLLAFFRKRLRSDRTPVPHSHQAPLLVRRTLARLARRRAVEASAEAAAPSGRSRPRKEEVLRAALMELRRLEEPAPPPDEAGPPIRRN